MLVALGSSSSGSPKVRHFPIRAFVSERKRAFGGDCGSGRVVVVVDWVRRWARLKFMADAVKEQLRCRTFIIVIAWWVKERR